jgi:chemotaxis protein histidine kinase CheA
MSDQTNHNARIFPVKTRFHQMAQRPGGVPREAAIERAEQHIEDLKPDFADWLDRELDELARSIRRLADDPASEAVLDDINQRCDQLRGVGGTMGFELVTFIASNFCDVLEAIKAGAPCDPSVIDCHMDALLLAKTPPYRNVRPDQVPEMTSGLRRVAELTKALAERDGDTAASAHDGQGPKAETH